MLQDYTKKLENIRKNLMKQDWSIFYSCTLLDKESKELIKRKRWLIICLIIFVIIIMIIWDVMKYDSDILIVLAIWYYAFSVLSKWVYHNLQRTINLEEYLKQKEISNIIKDDKQFKYYSKEKIEEDG